MEDRPTTRERFQGCLLGLAVGDGLGARFEGQSAEHVRARYSTQSELIGNPPNNELWYTDDELVALGNGIEALESVPTAIACFALAPTSFETAVANAVFLGGDTDTIAAMTGAMAGDFLGIRAIPSRLLHMLEDQGKGRTYITELADRLHQAYESCREKSRLQ